MKTAEEILCEVYGCMDKEELSRFFSIHEKSSQMILEAMEIYASQKHITDGYPKEFVNWLGEIYIYGHHGTWIARYTDQRIRENWKSTDELYQYWLTNVKDK